MVTQDGVRFDNLDLDGLGWGSFFLLFNIVKKWTFQQPLIDRFRVLKLIFFYIEKCNLWAYHTEVKIFINKRTNLKKKNGTRKFFKTFLSDINLGSFTGLRQHLELVCCIAGWLESTLKPRNNGHFGVLS